jgi:hypothetical protein
LHGPPFDLVLACPIIETSRQAYQLMAYQPIPMAISLGFGIVFATALLLVIVPCLYLILEDVLAVARAS